MASVFVPNDGGFALIGDADGGNFRGCNTTAQYGFFHNSVLRSIDFHGILFHSTGMGIFLGKFFLRHGADNAPVIDEQSTGTSGALIQSENVRHDETSFF